MTSVFLAIMFFLAVQITCRYSPVENLRLVPVLLVRAAVGDESAASSAALSSRTSSASRLTVDYYNPGKNHPGQKWRSCPSAEKVVAAIVDRAFKKDVSVSGPLVRLFFHDCFVQGCDASILLDPPSRGLHSAEKNADPNLSLRGFDIINKIKSELEKTCPGVVSCADILAMAARDAIHKAGGPYIRMPYGRRDGFGSRAISAVNNLPSESWRVHNLLKNFGEHGLNILDLVALSGAHTIGIGHCDKVSARLPPNPHDPTLAPKYEAFLSKGCKVHRQDAAFSLKNDFFTPNKFDNQYFKNLLNGYGLFTSDAALANDKRTRNIVKVYAHNQTVFFHQFAISFLKMGNQKIIFAPQGQIRNVCSRQN